MSDNQDWSPDEPMETEAFEQDDEAIDEASLTDPEFAERLELDPSLDPAQQADDRELEEIGGELDDPEDLVTLDGGIDDPDGLGGPSGRSQARDADRAGWDLDAPVVSGAVPEDVLEDLPEEEPPD